MKGKNLMKRMILILVLAVAVGACNKTPTSGEGSDPGGGDGAAVPAGREILEDNIGDVEQAIHVAVEVAQKSQGVNVKATPLIDQMQRMNFLTLDVSPPPPKELWLNLKVKTRRAFPENPALLHIIIKDGDRELGRFSSVVGKSQTPSVSDYEFNVLEGVPALPETMLVNIVVDAMLMPKGTDEATIDPATATVKPQRRSTATATPPVRINFTGLETPAAPAEGPQAEEGSEDQ